MEHKLDNIDRKIIEMLQKNARTPVKEIAKEVFLSSPAVSARIEHLEKNGLITGYHAQINPVFLGYHIKAFINLEVEPNQKKDFYPFIQSIPSVSRQSADTKTRNSASCRTAPSRQRRKPREFPTILRPCI